MHSGKAQLHSGKPSPSATLREECSGYLFTEKTSSPRAKNRALEEGFPESRSDTRVTVDVVGEQSTPFPSLFFFKKNLLRVQHSGKTPSSPRAAAQTLGEDTLFPERRSLNTWGRNPLPRALQPKHSGKKLSSPSATTHALREATLEISFFIFYFPCKQQSIYISQTTNQQ